MHRVAVDPACTDTPVRAFGTFTQDLHHLAEWFKETRRTVSDVHFVFNADALHALVQ